MKGFHIITDIGPVFTMAPKRELGILTHDFRFEFYRFGRYHQITIEHGFEWDGMSIPRVAWASVGCPFGPKHTTAGLVHDYLYRTKLLTRKQADELMLAILKSDGEGWYARQKMYHAVRLFGRSSWFKAEKKQGVLRGL